MNWREDGWETSGLFLTHISTLQCRSAGGSCRAVIGPLYNVNVHHLLTGRPELPWRLRYHKHPPVPPDRLFRIAARQSTGWWLKSSLIKKSWFEAGAALPPNEKGPVKCGNEIMMTHTIYSINWLTYVVDRPIDQPLRLEYHTLPKHYVHYREVWFCILKYDIKSTKLLQCLQLKPFWGCSRYKWPFLYPTWSPQRSHSKINATYF